MKKKMTLAGLAAALFCGGCWFMGGPKNDTVETFDLAIPQARNQACGFARVRNLTPGGLKMLYREAGGQIRKDPSRCWVQVPEAMLMRYLQSTFLPAREPRVQLTLLQFELDLERSLAVLTADIAVERGEKRSVKRCGFTAPLKNDGEAAAMSVCAGKLAEAISKTLQEK